MIPVASVDISTASDSSLRLFSKFYLYVRERRKRKIYCGHACKGNVRRLLQNRADELDHTKSSTGGRSESRDFEYGRCPVRLYERDRGKRETKPSNTKNTYGRKQDLLQVPVLEQHKHTEHNVDHVSYDER